MDTGIIIQIIIVPIAILVACCLRSCCACCCRVFRGSESDNNINQSNDIENNAIEPRPNPTPTLQVEDNESELSNNIDNESEISNDIENIAIEPRLNPTPTPQVEYNESELRKKHYRRELILRNVICKVNDLSAIIFYS